MTDEPRPFQSLSAREAGLPVDTTLYEKVPEWLDGPIRAWVDDAMDYACDEIQRFPEKVAMKLRLPIPARARELILQYPLVLGLADRAVLFDIVDAVLQLHPGWNWGVDEGGDEWKDSLKTLEVILEYGSSAYNVDRHHHQLVRRVDRTVTDAVDVTVASAPADAAQHLRTAWTHAYGLHPDPTTAYREAVLAVEAVACPLVLPLDKGATLGKVLAHLKQGGARWEMTLLAKDGGSGPEPFVALLERLWTGQVSRHAGSEHSRGQTQREAEAAVHLAVLAVQWLSSEVLRRK